ncbi:MAG: hypothetical protein C5B47_03005 [Verrucomicrobia bacterium]|nr:MAG: hypothetical protein C5B47_03005 [Verrucomicrobiota bacterium]
MVSPTQPKLLSSHFQDLQLLTDEAEELTRTQENKNDKYRQLAFYNLASSTFHNRGKRALTHNTESVSVPVASIRTPTNSNASIAMDEIYEIFKSSTRDKNRASFSSEQGQKILDFYKQENAQKGGSIYQKIFDTYEGFGNFKEISWELDSEFKLVGDKLSSESIRGYIRNKSENASPKEQRVIAERLLFNLKSAGDFLSDLLSKNIYTAEPIVKIFQDTQDQMRLRNSILLLGGIRRYRNQLPNGHTQSQGDPYQAIIYNSIDKLTKALFENRDILKRAFTRYLELKQKTDFSAVLPATKDYFAAISQFIHHPDARLWEAYPSLKREFIFNLSRFFHQKNLIKPKELDNQQGPDFERIDELVQNAIKKYKSSLEPGHAGYSERELRVYNSDKTKHVLIDYKGVKHVAERHYSLTFNPVASKKYNTKFRADITLDNIVETIYEKINCEKADIFGSSEEFYALNFAIKGQTYQIGIEIPGNKKIVQGNVKIQNGTQKKVEGEEKQNKPDATSREKGEGNKLKKLGEQWIREGQELLAEGLAMNLRDGGYRFKQFYPEPRNAVVLVMSHKDITTPENNPQLRNLLTAFGERYQGHRIPATYYALVFSGDAIFEIKRLTSDPTKAATEKWVWAPQQENLKGVYTKITLAGHGNHDPEGGMRVPLDTSTQAVTPNLLANAFATLFSRTDTEVQHARLLACHQRPEILGDAIRKSLQKRGVKTEQIIGSEAEVYITNNLEKGVKKASKYYINPEEIPQNPHRGVEEVKWILDIDSKGELKGAPKRVTSHGDSNTSIDIANHSETVSGPFGKKAIEVANNLQQATRTYSEAQRQINESLATLDSIVAEVKEAGSRIVNKPNSQWFIAIDKIRPVEQGYVIHALEKESSTWREISLSKERGEALIAARERIRTAAEFLKPHFEKGSEGSLRPKASARPSTPTTLNAGFLAVALMSRLREKDAEMSLETKISFYWNLTGSGASAAEELVEIGKLVIAQGTVQNSLQKVSSFFEVNNMIFMLGDLGWNFYQLATVIDPAARVGLGIQTGFTTGAVVLQGGAAFVAWWIPAAAETAGTAATFTGPIIALGIGFSALGTQIKQNNTKMHALFAHLVEAKKAYQNGGFEKNSDVLIPQAHAVITKLDFKKRKIAFGSQQVMKSKYEGFFSPSSIFQDHDWERFNLREAFGIPETAEFDSEAGEIVLPATPNINVDYAYINVAPSMSTEEASLAAELDRTGYFSSGNSTGTLKPAVTSSRGIKTRPLKIDVILDHQDRTLWFNHEINENVSYDIQIGGGRVNLRGLHCGVRLTLGSGGEKNASPICMEAPVVLSAEDAVGLEDGVLTIKEAPGKLIRVDVSRLRGTLRVKGTAAEWNVNLDTGKVRLCALDLRRMPRDQAVFDSFRYLNSLSNKGLTDDIVCVTHGTFPRDIRQDASAEEKTEYWRQVQEAEKSATHSVYDSKTKQMIQPVYRLHAATILQGSRLVGATEKQIYFFHSEKKVLWSIHRTTLAQTYYELGFTSDQSRIDAVVEIKGRIIIKQSSYLGENRTERVTLFHSLEGNKVRMLGLSGLSNDRLKQMINFLQNLRINGGSNLPDARVTFEQATQLHKVELLSGTHESHRFSEISEWVPIEGVDADGFPQEILANFQKGCVINLNRYQISNLQFIKSSANTVWFWSPENGKAYFANVEAGISEPLLSEVDTGGKKIVWYGPNENTDKIDFVTEGGEDVITGDQQGWVIQRMETLTQQEWERRKFNVPLSA